MIITIWLVIVLFAANGDAYEIKKVETPDTNTMSVAQRAVLLR